MGALGHGDVKSGLWKTLNEWTSAHPFMTAVLIVAAWTAVLMPWQDTPGETQWGLWYVLAVVAAASLAGERAAIAAALLSFGAWNFFFIPPYYTFRLARPSLWIDLTVFLIVGSVVGLQTALRRRKEHDALAREAEARLLNRLLGELASPPPATEIPDVVLDRVAEALDPVECALYLARTEGGFNRTWRPQPASWPSGRLPIAFLSASRRDACQRHSSDAVTGSPSG